jgi:hypothetical protein
VPASAEAEAQRRGGIKGYRTIKRGDRTILVAIVPQAGPKGGHTVSMAGPVGSVRPKAAPSRARKKMTKKQLRALAKRRKARHTGTA